MIFFEIPGTAVPQGRPRFARWGSKTIAYDPAKSKKWKEYVRLIALTAKCRPLNGPLRLRLTFFLQAPKNLDAKLRAGKNIAHVKKPDLSNIIKGIEDALKGICYHDDSQIVELRATKAYAVKETYVLVEVSNV